MPDDELTTTPDATPEGTPDAGGDTPAPAKKAARKAPAKKAAAKKAVAEKTTAKKTAAKKTTTKKAAKAAEPAPADEPVDEAAAAPALAEAAAPEAAPEAAGTAVLFQVPEPVVTTRKRSARKTTKKAAEVPAQPVAEPVAEEPVAEAPVAEEPAAEAGPKKKTTRKSSRKKAEPEPVADEPEDEDETAELPAPGTEQADEQADGSDESDEASDDQGDDQGDEQGDEQGEGGGSGRRRRRRGGRRRRKSGGGDAEGSDEGEQAETDGEADGESGEAESDSSDAGESGEGGTSRRRRRRRRSGDDGGGSSDDPENTVTRVRRGRSAEDQITAVSGSTRLEAKKQRRREGREAGRRRAPIVSEAEFLARRESVDRVMVIRQRDDLTQIGVLEDKVLVEHYVARESQTSLIGNVYLGRVQNVLPSMEAAFVDIGRGRNAVLYAGEVNWSALGHKDGQPRKIESVLSSGQSVLVQVTKDPIGHKGARLTSQISLAGRFLVYVPDGTTSGISRKLPDTERNRLKTLLREIVPETAGVIVRTAAEGASEDELTQDVERLKARWEDIEKKTKGSAPQLLYGEPDLTLKVVRDLFTEDFVKLVIQGDDAWDTVQQYVQHMAPDLEERLEKYDVADHDGKDVFAAYRLDEQIAKGLDRKVWLPSGGSLIIDRTEAMTVVDVNTGKFTGSGGNLEETVTKNNLEAAEEIVRQLRLRDIGGIIVVDFIDMVLESNRDLVLRRLVECLGRDRTRHQVAEVTSLGLVQMTRKRIGTGLLEAFSETCEHCQGRGLVLHDHPVEQKRSDDEGGRGGGARGSSSGGGGRRSRGGRARGEGGGTNGGNGNGNGNGAKAMPSPKDIAAMARPPADEHEDHDEPDEDLTDTEVVDEHEASEELEDLEPVREPEPETVAEEPEPEPEPEPTPEPEPAPQQTTVVTRTRRRSASRPAGPPQHHAEPDPAGVPALHQATAGIGAERDGSVGAPALDGMVEPGTAAAEGDAVSAESAEPAEPAVEHVPIKRKGSRKR
nr:Rne/Rng family ribonuclease [Nocardioides anomalus]